MNVAGCANCFMHGWKQVEDPSSLQRCTKCKLIQYCGRECQSEHWKRIHKTQCKYFANPVKAQKWAHNEDCTICLVVAQVGKDEICRATNPNYECILKEKFPPHMYHPHPFPVSGKPGQTYEKAVIVLWQLLKKFELTQPEVIANCQGKLFKVFAELKLIRLDIWKARKISRQPECLGSKKFISDSLTDFLNTIREEVGSDESMEDLIQIIELVDHMLRDVDHSEFLQILLNPLDDLPADLHTIVSRALSNSTNFLTIANQVLDALTAQVVPYQDLKSFHTSKGVHRCSACLTVMYCSSTCQDQDWQIHKDFCKEEAEERKKKFGSSGRRKEARDVVERVEKLMEEMVLKDLEMGTGNDQLDQEEVEVMKKIKLKRASKKAKK